MYSRKETLGFLVAAVLLTVVMGVFTMQFNEYNLAARVCSVVCYFCTNVFIIVDGYGTLKNKSKYYRYSLIRDILVLLLCIVCFYCVGNFKTMIVVISSAIIVLLLVFIKKMNVLADEACSAQK